MRSIRDCSDGRHQMSSPTATDGTNVVVNGTTVGLYLEVKDETRESSGGMVNKFFQLMRTKPSLWCTSLPIRPDTSMWLYLLNQISRSVS